MNNPLDNSTSGTGNSQFDDLMQSLGIDLHHNINTPDAHGNSHHTYPDNLQQGGISDFTHASWNDSSSNFGHLPDHNTHHAVSQWHDSENGFAAATNFHHTQVSAKPQVMCCSYSSDKDGPYIQIDRRGEVQLHKLDGTTQAVGYTRGRDFYNSANDHIGYLGKDGHIYRWIDDSSVGRVEGGHIYRENGKEVGRADTDLEGAAHLLFVVRGGTP